MYKIGIFGSATGVLDDVVPKAEELGKVIGSYGNKIQLVTGACSGLPYVVAKQAYDLGSSVVGFSPMLDIEGQRRFTPDNDISIYADIIYIPIDFEHKDDDLVCKKFRNVLSTASCDAGIIISGRWGSLNEFTNLIDMRKVVGVLTGTGGVSDELLSLSQKISKEGQGKIVFNDDPKNLIKEVLNTLAK